MTDTPATSPADLLRASGLQVTAQRVAVLRMVGEHPHCSTDDVATAVHDELGAVSRQAIYDSLRILTDHGILHRIQPAGSVARYEARVGDNHHHVVCRRCGTVADVDCAVGDTPCLVAADDQGFEIDEAEVVYWGLCPTCLDAPAPTPT